MHQTASQLSSPHKARITKKTVENDKLIKIKTDDHKEIGIRQCSG